MKNISAHVDKLNLLRIAACVDITQGLWASQSNPVAYVTPDYDVPVADAYCEPVFDGAPVELVN